MQSLVCHCLQVLKACLLILRKNEKLHSFPHLLLNNILSADIILSNIITVKCEGQLVIDMS